MAEKMERTSQSKSAAGKMTASASKKGAMKHNFRDIHINGAANGYSMNVEQPRSEGEKGMYEMPKVDTHVFSGDDAHEKMFDKMREIMGVKGSGKNVAADSDSSSKETKSKPAKSGKMDAEDKKDEGEDVEDDND